MTEIPQEMVERAAEEVLQTLTKARAKMWQLNQWDDPTETILDKRDCGLVDVPWLVTSVLRASGLVEELTEARARNEKLTAALRYEIESCAACGGSGIRLVGRAAEQRRCSDCEDARAALSESDGEPTGA